NGGGTPVTWTEHLVDPTCFGGHYLMAADLNGDGATDLLVAPWTLNSLIWYIQDPADPEAWERHDVDSTFTTPLTAFPADIDGDGKLDIIGTSPALGEISWWKISEFIASGTLESSILDLEQDQGLIGLRWSASVPSGDSLTLSVRSGDDPVDLGPWSPEIMNPTVMLCPRRQYLQYRLTMKSPTGQHSPILRDLTMWWNQSNWATQPFQSFDTAPE
ncbi:MAG: VCBS repeat-containing protein, partial [Acidobacteriota bacterium]